MKILILVNRGSGGADDNDAVTHDRVEAAIRHAGLDGEIRLMTGRELEARAQQAVEGGANLIIVAGGDGSISAVAGALSGTGTALGILPMGTRNHLARDLRIPTDLAAAADLIATGNRRRIDVAEVNGRIFVNNSAIGIYPLMVVDRESQQHRLGRSKRLAMVVASLRTLARFHDQRLTLSANGGRSMVDTPLLFVGNNDYRLSFPASGKRDRLDDGHLCVLLMRKKGVPGFLAAALRALVGVTRDDDMVRLDSVDHLRVESRSRRLTVSIDGETCAMEAPLDYRIRKGALTVIAPPA